MNIMYVDDEKPALDNFRLTVANFTEVDHLQMFQNGQEALDYATNNDVDVAFLDMEMPGIHGLGLAKKLKENDANIRIVFVTAYSQYALDAWGVDATGYLLKPYTPGDIRKELAKCAYRPLPSQKMVIKTMPNFSVTINGSPLKIPGVKPKEMLALLVDRGENGFTTGEGIACLWPERSKDASTQSLLRMTYKRLLDSLEEVGMGHILVSEGNRRAIKVEEVDCDLYRILAGNPQAEKQYRGQYLQEYSWAEERNSELYWMLQQKNPKR